MTVGFSRGRGDRGAAGLEYAAAITVGALVVTGLFLSVTGIVDPSLRPAICRLFGGECRKSDQAQRPPDWTKCNIHDANRSLGFNAAFRGIRGDVAGKDQIITQVNPATGEKSAQVLLTGKGGLGLETGDRDDLGKPGDRHDPGALGKLNTRLAAGANGKVDLSALAGLNTELTFRYDFTDGQGRGDPYANAEKFLDNRRGSGWKRVISGLGGTNGGALENGTAAVVNKSRRLWARLRGKDTKELDRREGETPTAVTFRVGGEATAGGKWSGSRENNKLPFDANAETGVEGKVTTATDVTIVIDDKKNPKNNGSRIATSRFTADASGKIQGGLELKRLLPKAFEGGPKGALETGAGIAGTQTVIFDRHGNPTRFTVQLDREWKGGGSLGLGGGPDKDRKLDVKGKQTPVGHRRSNLYSLDLTKPENRAAFDKLFATPVGLTVVPKPAALGGDLGRFGATFDRNGQEIQFDYDTSGQSIEPGGTNGEKGIKRKGFGFGWSDEKTWAKYRSGKYFDHQAPQAGWQALANCPRG